ncbi:alpha-1,2-fucosyltransferase [Roseibium suaedae]|uniref:Glycosyl transferase family 11 n=1 Tax=Roseibium suaedae TaxID=735517 RepID=A0A1M6YVM9_9HYPH|nr:alpha-1,2-fucosyltransferase [Roseibium suaedae]SHL22374.1 Glycosyl transferase family 11 [Roseibium suaedae]
MQTADLKNAVVTRLQGGLGNLLFQYMAGQSLADHLNVPHHCVAGEGIGHGSALELVGIEPSYVSVPAFMIKRAGKKRDRSLTDFLRTGLGRWPLMPVREPQFHYWPGFFDLKSGCLLSGYWQSPKYFSELKTPPASIMAMNAVLNRIEPSVVSGIREGTTVCIHIRRGDYLKEPSALEVHGLIEPDYYERGHRMMEELHAPDRYLVFSDSPDLAREALGHLPKVVFMEPRPQEQDLALMSLCHHHIIANSSFSWWGAWLGRREGQTVIAPRYWFSPQTLRKKYVLDLIPDDWVLL